MMAYTRDNLDSSTVVSSWWDYGNWLGIIGNVTTLCDNTTVNGTQIENVGYSMMANETQSIKMHKEYNAKYVLVFLVLKFETSSSNTLTGNVTFAGYGDEGKWMWMARISGGAETRLKQSGYMNDQYSWTNEEAFGNYTTSSSGVQSWVWNDMGTNSTIYKLMSYAEQKWAAANGFTAIEAKATPTFFKEAYIAGADITYTQAAQQYGGLIPLVCLFEIDYDAYNNATAAITP
jgi:asparagine N-glycosylation enzyme membrane subunit Stt3